jgi:hypothetical protein
MYSSAGEGARLNSRNHKIHKEPSLSGEYARHLSQRERRNAMAMLLFDRNFEKLYNIVMNPVRNQNE